LGRSSNFVGFESGQTQSVKLMPNMVSNRTPYAPVYVHMYTVLIHTGKRGRVEPERRGKRPTERSIDHKAGLKIPT